MSEVKRNLTADIALCDAATVGPWWEQDNEATWQLFGGEYGQYQLIKAPKYGTDYAEYWPPAEDARFIAEARTGWPHAIRRAIDAEAEVERQRKLMRYAQDMYGVSFAFIERYDAAIKEAGRSLADILRKEEGDRQ